MKLPSHFSLDLFSSVFLFFIQLATIRAPTRVSLCAFLDARFLFVISFYLFFFPSPFYSASTSFLSFHFFLLLLRLTLLCFSEFHKQIKIWRRVHYGASLFFFSYLLRAELYTDDSNSFPPKRFSLYTLSYCHRAYVNKRRVGKRYLAIKIPAAASAGESTTRDPGVKR